VLPRISPVLFFEYAAADGIPVCRKECVAVVRIRLPVIGVDQLRLSCLFSEGAEAASRGGPKARSPGNSSEYGLFSLPPKTARKDIF